MSLTFPCENKWSYSAWWRLENRQNIKKGVGKPVSPVEDGVHYGDGGLQLHSEMGDREMDDNAQLHRHGTQGCSSAGSVLNYSRLISVDASIE